MSVYPFFNFFFSSRKSCQFNEVIICPRTTLPVLILRHVSDDTVDERIYSLIYSYFFHKCETKNVSASNFQYTHTYIQEIMDQNHSDTLFKFNYHSFYLSRQFDLILIADSAPSATFYGKWNILVCPLFQIPSEEYCKMCVAPEFGQIISDNLKRTTAGDLFKNIMDSLSPGLIFFFFFLFIVFFLFYLFFFLKDIDSLRSAANNCNSYKQQLLSNIYKLTRNYLVPVLDSSPVFDCDLFGMIKTEKDTGAIIQEEVKSNNNNVLMEAHVISKKKSPLCLKEKKDKEGNLILCNLLV
jgi:hypothetical protein